MAWRRAGTDRALNKFTWMEALRGADLTHAEYRVLLNLSTWANGDLGNAYPGVSALCEAAQVSLPTAKKALKSLTAKGWIVLTERGGNQFWKGKANVYSLAIPKGAAQSLPSSSQGGKPFTEGGTSVSEGGNSAPREGASSLTPHHEELPVHPINGYDQRVVVALGDAGARGRTAEEALFKKIDTELVEETVQASSLEANLCRRAATLIAHPPIEVRPVSELAPDPAINPIAWLDNSLPLGFLVGERTKAQQMLEAGRSHSSVRYAILRERQSSGRKRSLSGRSLVVDNDAKEGPA